MVIMIIMIDIVVELLIGFQQGIKVGLLEKIADIYQLLFITTPAQALSHVSLNILAILVRNKHL